MTRTLALAALFFVGCASDPDFDEIVDDHRRDRTGLRDCGEVEVQNDCRPVDPAEQCFMDAYTACEPAELRIRRHTVEGDILPSVYFVEPGDECHILEFTDHSADEYKGDYGDVVESSCTDVWLDGPPVCVYLELDECTKVDEWY